MKQPAGGGRLWAGLRQWAGLHALREGHLGAQVGRAGQASQRSCRQTEGKVSAGLSQGTGDHDADKTGRKTPSHLQGVVIKVWL